MMPAGFAQESAPYERLFLHRIRFHPEMVFLANLGVNLHVCLCGDLQVASAQTLDFPDIGQKSSFPDWKVSPTAKSFPDGHEFADGSKLFPGKERPFARLVVPRGRRKASFARPGSNSSRSGMKRVLREKPIMYFHTDVVDTQGVFP
ncbi:hypothetical protein TRIP_B50454 [uncultured Desulfatiglans sp.]|nr:hypothetical protein TRIP_B50454 [uncultured Desulfatiglans sp.]